MIMILHSMVYAKIVSKLTNKKNIQICYKKIENKKEMSNMDNYICTVCHWVYEPAENGNVAFEDLPEDYICPLCGVGKELFEKQ